MHRREASLHLRGADPAGHQRVAGPAADSQRDLQLVPGQLRIFQTQRCHLEGRLAHHMDKWITAFDNFDSFSHFFVNGK